MTTVDRAMLIEKLRTTVNQAKDVEMTREDIRDIKLEMGSHIDKKLVGKAIKVYMNKTVNPEEVSDYQKVCDMLGISYACNAYMPDQNAAKNEGLIEVLKRYEVLAEELKEESSDLNEGYKEYKKLGISVPVIKKFVDFCLHPDKLQEFYDTNPYLESYIKLIPEVD
jgi:uncharacterized protein (UPF0335 family)